jgi:hypothetical protein
MLEKMFYHSYNGTYSDLRRPSASTENPAWARPSWSANPESFATTDGSLHWIVRDI